MVLLVTLSASLLPSSPLLQAADIIIIILTHKVIASRSQYHVMGDTDFWDFCKRYKLPWGDCSNKKKTIERNIRNSCIMKFYDSTMSKQVAIFTHEKRPEFFCFCCCTANNWGTYRTKLTIKINFKYTPLSPSSMNCRLSSVK